MTLEYQTVPVATQEVYVLYSVMFKKVNVTVKFNDAPPQIPLVVTVVVTGSCIGFTAGAFAGKRIPSAAMVTQAITRTLITSCLFKSVPSRCWL